MTLKKKQAPKYLKTPPAKKKTTLPILLLCLAILVLAGLSAGYWWITVGSDPNGGRILPGVSIGGVDVGGMTRSQAAKALTAAVGNVYSETDMVLTLSDAQFTFTPAQTGAKLNARHAAALAYRFGRDASAPQEIPLLECIKLDQSVILSALNAYRADHPTAYLSESYRLEGEMPALDAEHFDENEPCQLLLLTNGIPGLTLDMDAVFEQVMDAYASQQFQVTIREPSVLTPAPLDLNAIAEQICSAPVEPQVDLVTYGIIPGSVGYSFDLEAAQALLDAAAPGETVCVPMHYVDYTLHGEDVYFQDLLGYAKTPHSNNENRNDNLRLACSLINGVIVYPGETFSYNDTVGERSKENGFKPAPAYSGTKLVDSPGGGVCQVSSTLFLATLYAELETVDRVNHGYPANYMPIGLDATVNYGITDFKFRNDSNFPIKIVAQESDGYVRVCIFGTEVRDYYVKMEYRSGGHYATAYTCKYDPETDELLDRQLHHRSGFLDEVTGVYGWSRSEELDFELPVTNQSN